MRVSSPPTVVFVCLHGTAKSVIAAAYLNRLSAERGLNIRAIAAGIEPEPEVPSHVTEGLLRDVLDVRHYRARNPMPEELATAWRVVSFGCDLSHAAPSRLAVVRWDDVPLVSDGFPPARDAIVRRVRQLLDVFESKQVETHRRGDVQRQGREKNCPSGRLIWSWHAHKITRSRVGSGSARNARDASPELRVRRSGVLRRDNPPSRI